MPDYETLDFHPAEQDAVAGRYLPVARSFWPGSKCAGREQVAWFYTRPMVVAGVAYPTDGGCRFALNFALLLGDLRGDVCSVMVHELGHLARGDDWHSDDPTNLLYPQFRRPPACYQRPAKARAVP
jgi:hypothetical protein